jgi:HTH-type transcriptional regulator/antitoxin HipB
MLIHSPKELALFVIDQRKQRKLSQAEVADLVGLRQSTISAFENNPENTKLDTLFRILSAVHSDMHALSKGDSTLKALWKEEW